MLIIKLFTLIAISCPSAPLIRMTTATKQIDRDPIAWEKDANSGVPFFTALNVVVKKYPPSVRMIYIFIEPQDFNRENLRNVFRYLSAKYPQPETLMIKARSNRISLIRWMEYMLAFNSIMRDGSFVRNKDRPTEPPTDLLFEKGYYRAEYSRASVLERFTFSAKPDVDIMQGENIRQVTRFAPSGDNSTDLMMAVFFDLEGELRKLLKKGADVNAANTFGSRPLITAILAGRSKMVMTLLENGADINQACFGGWTALMCALFDRNTLVAEELLKRGADVDARADNGDTALTIATEQGMTGIVEQLLRKGADVRLRDRFGRTALMIAEENGFKAIIKALR